MSRIFSCLIKLYRRYQKKDRQRKIEFLMQQTFYYFYIWYILFYTYAPEIPDFIYKEQAKKYAFE